MFNKQSFLYQSGVLALSNSALFLLGFAYRILIGRMAGAEGMGVYTLVMQVYAIIMAICVYGMCIAVTHMGASLYEKRDLHGIRALVCFAFSCFLFLFLLLALPVLLFHKEIASGLLGDPRTARALLMILACVFLTGFENVLKALFNGLRMVKYPSLSEVGEQILRIVFAAALLIRFMNDDHGHTALLILTAMTLSEVYSVILLVSAYIRRIVRPSVKRRANEINVKGTFIKLALPSIFTSIFANVFASLTVILFPMRLMVAGYTRLQAVSILGVVSGMLMPILTLPSAFIFAICTLLMPTIAACASKGDAKELKNKINKGIEAISLIGLPVSALLLPFSSLLCALLFGQTVPFLLVLLFSLDVLVVYYITLVSSILNGLGKQKQVLYLALLREAMQLSAVWFLSAAPSLHVYGYAMGLIAGDLLHVLIGMRYIRSITGAAPRLFHTLIVPAACATILYCCARIFFFKTLLYGATIVAAICISLLASMLLFLLLLRILGLNWLKYIRRSAFLK